MTTCPLRSAPRPPRRARRIGTLLALGLLLAPVEAPAQADPPAAGKPPPLRRDDLDLLPLSEVERLRLLRAHGELVARAEIVLKRAGRVDELLRERADDPGAQALLEERKRLARQAEALVPEIEAALATLGLGPEALSRARLAPRGALRAERFAHAQVVAMLRDTQGAGALPGALPLFERLVPQVDGAMLALLCESERLRQGSPGEERAALAGELEQRRKDVARRFWRLVYWALDTPTRASLARRLPGDLRKHDDAIAHIYLLPGLTPSQGVAVKALLLELEAEAAADTSELKRVQAALARGDLPAEQRRAEEAALKDCQARLADLQVAAYERGLALLTSEQATELLAVPPFVSGPERSRRLEETLEGLRLEAPQREALRALSRRYAEPKARYERGALDIQRRLKDAGPDSPEREMAEMMYAGLSGEIAATLREAHGEVFLTVLTPDQVEAWVLGLKAP
jgi:hypothetical protein